MESQVVETEFKLIVQERNLPFIQQDVDMIINLQSIASTTSSILSGAKILRDINPTLPHPNNFGLWIPMALKDTKGMALDLIGGNHFSISIDDTTNSKKSWSACCARIVTKDFDTINQVIDCPGITKKSTSSIIYKKLLECFNRDVSDGSKISDEEAIHWCSLILFISCDGASNNNRFWRFLFYNLLIYILN